MPRNIYEPLGCWNRDGNQSSQIGRDGRPPQLAYGGLFNERGTRDVLNIRAVLSDL